MNVLVYGSLKKGRPLNYLLKSYDKLYPEHKPCKGVYIGCYELTIPDCSLHRVIRYGSFAFPALVQTGKTEKFVAELWSVSSLNDLDQAEGYPNFYDRMRVSFRDTIAWMYYLDLETAKICCDLDNSIFEW